MKEEREISSIMDSSQISFPYLIMTNRSRIFDMLSRLHNFKNHFHHFDFIQFINITKKKNISTEENIERKAHIQYKQYIIIQQKKKVSTAKIYYLYDDLLALSLQINPKN